MEIRSITYGQAQALPIEGGRVSKAGRFLRGAKGRLQDAGYEVQTVRLATQPVSSLLEGRSEPQLSGVASTLETACAEAQIDYCSVGPILAAGPAAPSPLIGQIPDLLSATERVFVSVMPATTREGLNLRAVHETARALAASSAGDAEGTRPRRLTLSANVPPEGPFFPSAYHLGDGDGFSVALEASDLAVEAFERAATFEAARTGLMDRLVFHGSAIARAADSLAAEAGLTFHGMDISLAPFPEASRSIGTALERLGVSRFGASGTLFASAFITRILSEAPLPKCGFSGLMIPLLEDSVMASRHAEGAYSLDSLLLYSAVCGAGLDTIPVPGDSTPDQIASVYLDLCTLSIVLDKPLTVRLMPLAGKKAGDSVTFAFPYFAPTTVVDLGAGGSGGLFTKSDWVEALGGRR